MRSLFIYQAAFYSSKEAMNFFCYQPNTSQHETIILGRGNTLTQHWQLHTRCKILSFHNLLFTLLCRFSTSCYQHSKLSAEQVRKMIKRFARISGSHYPTHLLPVTHPFLIPMCKVCKWKLNEVFLRQTAWHSYFKLFALCTIQIQFLIEKHLKFSLNALPHACK